MKNSSLPISLRNLRSGERFAKSILGCLLPDKSTTHQLSSDIIESTFGYFKRRKSPNNLNGVTAFSLIIPAHTKMNIDNNEEFNFKQALESVSYPDLIHWKKENLLTNWVSIRRKKLVG